MKKQWYGSRLFITSYCPTPIARTMKLHCKLKLASYCLLNEINWSTVNARIGIGEVDLLRFAIQVSFGSMVVN